MSGSPMGSPVLLLDDDSTASLVDDEDAASSVVDELDASVVVESVVSGTVVDVEVPVEPVVSSPVVLPSPSSLQPKQRAPTNARPRTREEKIFEVMSASCPAILPWKAFAPAHRVVTVALVTEPNDRYVPVPADAIVAAVAGDRERFGDLVDHVAALEEALEHVVEQEAQAFRRRLARRYEAFNPARETIDVAGSRPTDAAARDEECEEQRSMIAYLLDKANYERLQQGQVDAAIAVTNSAGLRIRMRPDRVRFIDLYVRGYAEEDRVFRTWRHPFRGETRRVELYRRLAVVFQRVDDDRLALKMFREIPCADVEALLPHAEVEMTPLDRLWVVAGGLGALGGVATKIWAVLVHGATLATNFLWAFIVAMLGLSVRSYFGYRSARYHRTSQMHHNLYYQNVANNAGVLHQLLGSITQEGLKEALLAYAILYARDDIGDVEALDQAVESWLRATFSVDVDFDGPDAVDVLGRLQLWADRERWRVLPPTEAIARLDEHWRRRRTLRHHVTAWRARAQR